MDAKRVEARFLALCRDARLPAPSVNVRIETRAGPLEVDFCWRERRLIVEVDGFETHGTRTAFERDRERGRLLAEAGWQPPLRFSWRQVVADTAVRTTLRRLLLSPD